MNKKNFLTFKHMGIEVAEEYISIPTYKNGLENLNPPLFGKGVRNIYPYKYQDSFSDEIIEKNYQSFRIRSQFIEVTILPEWGLHVYRAVDLITGRDMFHCPKVMKPANNAIRGAYVAGGVEMNFPVGHNAMTWSRCPLVFKKTDEGVSCFFYNIDRCSGMSITAGITITPDSRGLLFDQYLFNRTELPQPWYYWLNAGLVPHPSLRFRFPAKHMLGHFEGPFLETRKEYSYPVYNSVDYSRNLEVPEPIGLFAFGNIDGWFGAWYDDWNFGVARWAAPWQSGGKKFWSWGNSEEGLLWGQIAADQELPIPEIQSGQPEIQMDRGILPPYKARYHREWWFPVSGIGDIATASRYGALNILEGEKSTVLKFSMVSAFSDCVLLVNGKEKENGINLIPGKTVERKIPVRMDLVDQISLRSAVGTLIQWNSHSFVEPANVYSLLDNPVSVCEMSADELFRKGFHYHRMLRPDLAKKFYRQTLEKDASHSDTHVQLGLLFLFEDGNFQNTLKELEKAIASDRRNDQALYLHGLVCRSLGNAAQANADFSHCAATGETYIIPSLIQLVKKAIKEQELELALFILENGLTFENNPELNLLKALVLRQLNRTEEWKECLSQIDKLSGFCLMAKFEREFSGLKDSAFLISGGKETDDFFRIQCALEYAELGMEDEAVNLLSKCRSPEGRSEAGYLSGWLRKADDVGTEQVSFFAYGKEIKETLLYALERMPDDAAALFSLGCLLGRQGELQKASKLLEKALLVKPKNSLILTTLGRIYLKDDRVDEAVRVLRKAITAKPYNPLAWVELDNALKTSGKRDIEWLEFFKNAPEEILDNEQARESLARLCYDLNDLNRAVDLLKNFTFHPYELLHSLRNLWSDIYCKKALQSAGKKDFENAAESIKTALSYPDNLYLGKPLRRFDAETLYIAGLIQEKKGDCKKAETFFKKAAEEYNPDPTHVKPWSVLAELKLGRKEDGMKRLDELERKSRCYLESEFQPDLSDDFLEIIRLCNKIRNGWIPDIDNILKL